MSGTAFDKPSGDRQADAAKRACNEVGSISPHGKLTDLARNHLPPRKSRDVTVVTSKCYFVFGCALLDFPNELFYRQCSGVGLQIDQPTPEIRMLSPLRKTLAIQGLRH